jgi:hypothetical protein
LIFGRYAPFSQVPLGVQAKVVAIYEPPQYNNQDSVHLIDDPRAEQVLVILSHTRLLARGGGRGGGYDTLSVFCVS